MFSKRNISVLSVLVIVSIGGFFLYKRQQTLPNPTPKVGVTYNTPDEKPSDNQTNTSTANSSTGKTNSDVSNTIPASLLIKVPFTTQAPTANWDELHNEACEETTAIMANAYFNKIPNLTAETVEKEIAKLTEWQDTNQGFHLDQTSLEVAKMIELVYGLKTELKPLEENTIKKALTENKLVLVSFNGRLLKNPHFKSPGPIHHMLVITGWNADNFITNDPGTKFGENYQYKYETLYSAAADWDHTTNTVDETKKELIIISK